MQTYRKLLVAANLHRDKLISIWTKSPLVIYNTDNKDHTIMSYNSRRQPTPFQNPFLDLKSTHFE